MANDCESENYVAGMWRIFRPCTPVPTLRNIILAATYGTQSQNRGAGRRTGVEDAVVQAGESPSRCGQRIARWSGRSHARHLFPQRPRRTRVPWKHRSAKLRFRHHVSARRPLRRGPSTLGWLRNVCGRRNVGKPALRQPCQHMRFRARTYSRWRERLLATIYSCNHAGVLPEDAM